MKNRLSQSVMLAVTLLTLAGLVLSACTTTPAGPDTSLLGTIKTRGTMRVSSDPNYKPQSFLNEKNELDGFDVDVSKEVAKRLGVTAAFETPAWDIIVAGNWGGRWDVSIGSMTITPERKQVLYFSDPYYYTPAQFAVIQDSPIQSVDEFVGKTVCVGAGTTYDSYPNGTLKLEGETIIKQLTGVKVFTYETDQECIQAMQAGRKDFDGVLTAQPTVQDAIKSGVAIRMVGNPVYYEDLAAAFDKNIPNSDSFVAAVTKAIQDMHKDGTLTTLATKWYGIDLSTKK
jgi:polar amino acid transport system substrate-binding protein